MTALIRMLTRAGIVVDNPFHARRQYIRPRPGDAKRDFARVAGDMRMVDRDLRRVAKRELKNPS
jgi:hypothetical protein